MKLFAATVMSAGLALALSAPIVADPNRAIDSALSAEITDTGGWCCGTVWGFHGHAILRSLGAVSFAGTYTSGVDPYFTYDPDQGYVHPYGEVRALQLTITANNGDTLTLGGRTEWPEAEPAPDLTWTVTGATGRFDGYTGSGAYSASVGSSSLSLVLVGTLTG